MVRGSLGRLASRALSVGGKWQHQQLRRLIIHEYQVQIPPPPFSHLLRIRLILDRSDTS
jgi:hypothetical protein